MLFAECVGTGLPVSLATVYNTLSQLTEAGLLRKITLDGPRSFFDTYTTDHSHFYIEEEDILIDVLEAVALPHLSSVLPDTKCRASTS